MRILTILTILAWSVEAPGAAPTQETLDTCKLPHGTLVLPVRGAPEAQKGYVLRFSDQQFGVLPPNPAGTDRPSMKDAFERIRAAKAGDILYSRLNSGTFLAIAGRMADLGPKLLHELSGQELTRPGEVWSEKERSGAGERTPGVLEGIQAGHCYLVETLEGKYALVRLVHARSDGAMIQFVYQPDGTRTFEIPKGTVSEVAVNPEVEPAARTTTGTPTLPDAVRDLSRIQAHVLQRQMVIAQLMEIVRPPAQSQEAVLNKAEAMSILGKLRADEAVDLLVRELEFRNPYAPSTETTLEAQHPAVKALSEIGKPGSLAALRAIGQEKPGASARVADPPVKRAYLLVRVIRLVEGADVAEFLLKRELQKVQGDQGTQYEEAIKAVR
jgi:hypothetical protein